MQGGAAPSASGAAASGAALLGSPSAGGPFAAAAGSGAAPGAAGSSGSGGAAAEALATGVGGGDVHDLVEKTYAALKAGRQRQVAPGAQLPELRPQVEPPMQARKHCASVILHAKIIYFLESLLSCGWAS